MVHGRRVVELLALPTIALGVALVVAPDRARLAAHIWLLVVVGLGLLSLVRAIGSAFPMTLSPFTASLRRPRVVVERPAGLTRLERELSMAGTAEFDVHYRLRPALIELAGGLLASRRGIDLARDPERARAVLGDEAWELIRPDRPQPGERVGAGIDEARLGRVISTLEAI